MFYLSGEGLKFCFKHEKINEIESDDIKISSDVYSNFFRKQEEGKQFKVKNKNGENFEDIFEEVFEELL